MNTAKKTAGNYGFEQSELGDMRGRVSGSLSFVVELLREPFIICR